MIRPNLSFVEFTIRRWFNDNRPDLRGDINTNSEIVENLVKKIETEIQDLEPTAQKIYIHGFLEVNYPIVLTKMVKEILDEISEKEDEYGKIIQDWKNFAVYHAEVGEIMDELSQKNIPKKYLTTNDQGEIVYDEELKKEIERISKARIEREW